MRHAPAQGFGRDVDELDLVGGTHHGVRDRLALAHSGDAFDDVAERLEVLHVDRRDDVDPGGEELLDVLPALGVARAGRARVRQLVHHAHLGCPREHRVDVELGEHRAPVVEDRAGQHLEALEQLGGPGPSVGLDEPDDDVRAPLEAAAGLVQRGVGLADAGRRAEVDPQFTSAR